MWSGLYPKLLLDQPNLCEKYRRKIQSINSTFKYVPCAELSKRAKHNTHLAQYNTVHRNLKLWGSNENVGERRAKAILCSSSSED
jgi:hypothetical protein